MKRNVICIAGAHRSGTSMLTRLLHRCGLYLGPESDLMPAAADNPEGFWEHLKFVRLNDEVLNAVGAAWDLPPAANEKFDASQFRRFRTKAQLLIDSFDGRTDWGWKDPRNCLTLPFWHDILPELKVVVIVRNPLEAAHSMHQRNGTSYTFALRLWEIYNRQVITHTHPDRRLVTSYGLFFDQPEVELSRIAEFAGLPSEDVPSAAALVDQNHRHTSFTIEQLIDAGTSEEIVDLYRSILQEAGVEGLSLRNRRKGRISTGDQPTANKSPHAGSTNSLNLAIPEAERTRSELARRRGDEIGYLERINQLNERIETLRQELSAKAQHTALEIGRRDGRITQLEKDYNHLDGLLAREYAGRDKLLAELDRKRESLTQLEITLAAQASEARELRETTDQFRERFAQTNHLLHSYSIQLEQREQENLSLVERLAKQLRETKRIAKLFDDVERAAERLRQSRRWVLANFPGWLGARLSGRPVPGFGHLDKSVEKYQAWKKAHPDLEKIEDAIVALRPSQFPAMPPSAEPSQGNETRPPAQTTPPAPTKPIQFPIHDRNTVSIVIPVFNQVTYTQACLASIQEQLGEIPFQVIIVDDCSTDSTQSVIESLPGVIYIRNESNLGFIASCNRGAAAASGNYLLFLNNDTIVRRGWLENLLETFDLEPRAGLVGSKLVYPDGRLQEAGGIIWRDGSGWNRGKFKDPNAPEYNYLREVDYCSAASVMIPQSLFEQLEGFDTKYAPAYYEDTDLAFKVAQSGRKVLYQPLSVVIHYEGITGGTDITSGAKRYQQVNRTTFCAAWQSVLADRPVNGDIKTFYAPKGGKKRILVIDHHLPMFDRDSGSLRMFNILTILSGLGHQVTFLPDNLADIAPYGDALRKRGVIFLHFPYIKSVREYLEAEGEQFDVIILSRSDFAQKHLSDARQYAPQSHLIFDTVDLHFLREERQARILQDPEVERKATERRDLEHQLIDQADETWVVSPVERDLLLPSHPNQSIEIVSNIVDVPGSAVPFSERRDILFIGSFLHPPNIDAVLFFTREIFPSVREQLVGARFYIIGAKAPPEVVALADEQVIVTGYQPDVTIFFESVRLSVAPLRYGAGVKGKINQSMGFGVPVIATPIAAEGMSVADGEDIIIAEEPLEFARRLIELYQRKELWERISRNGLRKTSELFSVESARRKLDALFEGSRLSNRAPLQVAAEDSQESVIASSF